MALLTDDQKKEILSVGIAQAVKFLDDDAIDSILDAIELVANNSGGWVKYAVFGVTKVLRLLLGVPDDDVDQSNPI